MIRANGGPVLVQISAQKPFPLGGINGDDVHIWDADLKVIDQLLNDEEFIGILVCAQKRAAPQTKPTGRRRTALNRTLRAAALKHIKTWSFPTLSRELQRNLDYRAFTQFFGEKIPSFTTLSRNFARIDAKAVRELNERLIQIAIEYGVVRGTVYRQDTTVCETDVHYPTDSSLLQDGVGVLQRLVRQAEDIAPSFGHMRDRSKAVRNRVLEIARAARGRGEAAKKRRESSYRSLLRIVRPVVTEATRIAAKLKDRRVTRHLGWDWQKEYLAEAIVYDIETMLPRVEKVIRQTRARICRGINDWPDKIFSLFIPRTCVIRKGKTHKPNEFGRLVDIVEVENGIVSDYQVLTGNPDDGSLLLPAIKRHKERFGKPPKTVATDRGFWSAKNERQAYAEGVKRVSIPARGTLSHTRLRIQRSRWFRNAQRWRAAGEGRIGTLKNVFGMDRCKYKDIGEADDAAERWVGWCVFANNLVFVARAMRNQAKRDETVETKERPSPRAAA